MRNALVHAHPAVSVDDRGYVADWRDNLLPAVAPGDFEADLSQGSGEELATKFGGATRLRMTGIGHCQRKNLDT